MFCPKCGGQNPETGKFCRACGTDLGNVSATLSVATTKEPSFYIDHRGRKRSNDPDEIYSSAIRSMIGGFGFLIISIVLLTTGVAGGQKWWWAMLFPAFSMLARGVSQLAKIRRIDKKAGGAASFPHQNQFPDNQPNQSLPPRQTEWVQPESRYKTGDLVPPSVTENTTRHLEIDSEGQTMTLPKK